MLVLLFLAILLLYPCSGFHSPFAWNLQLGPKSDGRAVNIRRNKDLSSNKILLPGHSCYNATYNGTTIEFCYPLVIVSGVPKAGTSALYRLINEHPNFIGSEIKENCMRGNSSEAVWDYLRTLQIRTEKILKQKGDGPFILLSGCIYAHYNFRMHSYLHHPNTMYILLTRDLTDLAWSSYNYWCEPITDGEEKCKTNGPRWASPKFHYRSPEIFHGLVMAQLEGKSTFQNPNLLYVKLFEEPGFYLNIVAAFQQRGIHKDKIILVANEELSINSTAVWAKIIPRVTNIPSFKNHPQIKRFESIRINTGDKKGSRSITNISQAYESGVYEISKYRPVLQETRSIISSAWKKDCIWISKETGYSYSACH